MKKQVFEYCSQVRAERYLLNRMSHEEETLFQIHLETCQACRSYIDSIRNLSNLILDDESVSPEISIRKTPEKGKKIKLWSFISIAACILVVIGFSYSVFNNWDGRSGISTHTVYLDHQTKGDKAEMNIEMIFPQKEAVLLNTGTPLIFRWDMETNYRLVVLQGNQTLVENKGYGDHFSMPSVIKLEDPTVLDWVLTVDNKELKGKIYINKALYQIYEEKGF